MIPRRSALLACSIVLSMTLGGRIALGGGGVPFRRGDANADSRVNISDPVFLILFLFRGGEAPRCADAGEGVDPRDRPAGRVAPPAPPQGGRAGGGGTGPRVVLLRPARRDR